MESVFLKLGPLSVYTLSLFVVLAFLWFGFVIHKKGTEYHYKDESLYDLVIMSGVFGFLFARLGYVVANIGVFSPNWLRIILLSNYPGYNFIGLVVGVVLAVKLLSHQGQLKTYEGLDLTALGLMAAGPIWELGLVFSGHVTFIWKLPFELLMALLMLVFFVWLWRLEREYRTFLWYRYRKTQAKTGFIFGAYFFFMGIATLFDSWQIGLAFIVFGMVFIYYRSGRVLAHDFKSLIRKRKVV